MLQHLFICSMFQMSHEDDSCRGAGWHRRVDVNYCFVACLFKVGIIWSAVLCITVLSRTVINSVAVARDYMSTKLWQVAKWLFFTRAITFEANQLVTWMHIFFFFFFFFCCCCCCCCHFFYFFISILMLLLFFIRRLLLLFIMLRLLLLFFTFLLLMLLLLSMLMLLKQRMVDR